MKTRLLRGVGVGKDCQALQHQGCYASQFKSSVKSCTTSQKLIVTRNISIIIERFVCCFPGVPSRHQRAYSLQMGRCTDGV